MSDPLPVTVKARLVDENSSEGIQAPTTPEFVYLY
jgi:hypothetical protein